MRRILLGSAAALATITVLPISNAGATHSTGLGTCINPFQGYDDRNGDGTVDDTDEGPDDCYPGVTDSPCKAPPYSVYGALGLGAIHTIGTGGNDTTFYVDDRDYATGNGIWVYQEANFTGGLQRGGSAQLLESLGVEDAEICDDGVAPDYLIF